MRYFEALVLAVEAPRENGVAMAVFDLETMEEYDNDAKYGATETFLYKPHKIWTIYRYSFLDLPNQTHCDIESLLEI